MDYRYEIVGERSKKVGNTGFTKGYEVITYFPEQTGFNVSKRFRYKKQAIAYKEKLKKRKQRTDWGLSKWSLGWK